MADSPTSRIESCGYVLLREIFDRSHVRQICESVSYAFGNTAAFAVRRGEAGVYAARNVLEIFPQAAAVWRKPVLVGLLRGVLGDDFGLVRVLFFDKPPGQSWALPWHKDVTIAIRNGELAAKAGYRVRTKAGVPHVEPPIEVLENMLSLRLHLDAATPENGPLRVVAGSHRTGKRVTLDDGPQELILADPGDILAVRPLVSHCSGRSVDGTQQHRRILHFEFSGTQRLPDGLEWHDYLQPSRVRVGDGSGGVME